MAWTHSEKWWEQMCEIRHHQVSEDECKQTREYLRDLDKEIWKAGFRYNWSKLEAADKTELVWCLSNQQSKVLKVMVYNRWSKINQSVNNKFCLHPFMANDIKSTIYRCSPYVLEYGMKIYQIYPCFTANIKLLIEREIYNSQSVQHTYLQTQDIKIICCTGFIT